MKAVSSRSQRGCAWLVVALVGSWQGCAEPLALPQSVDGPRLLGAHAQVVGDTERSNPRPGESVQVEWLVMGPEGPLALPGRTAACRGVGTARGLAECEGTPYESGRLPESNPRATFSVPPLSPGDEAADTLAMAAFCVEGSPQVRSWPEDIACEDGSTPLVGLLDLCHDVPENTNPELGGARFVFDGDGWSASSPSSICEDSSRPVVAADGRSHEVSIELPAEARQETPHGLERLEVSAFATRGSLDHPVGFIEPDTESMQLRFSWQAPSNAESEAEAAWFVFVVRDLRGGVVWVPRRLCLRSQQRHSESS
jgi:hypothetical protein